MHPPTAIRTAAILLLQQMQEALRRILCQSNKDMEKKLADAVFTAEQYGTKLYELIPDQGFTDPDEEICFFKTIKPLFTAEKEYHRRLYHAQLFGSGAGNEVFWDHELTRMEKLLDHHAEFVDYYRKGLTCQDSAWFVQGQAPLPTELCMSCWETNPKHTSERDGWVGGLLAVERYMDWLKIKQRDPG